MDSIANLASNRKVVEKMKFLLILALIAVASAVDNDGTQVYNAFKKLTFDYLKVDTTQLGAQLGCVETQLLGNKAFLKRLGEYKDYIDADRPRRSGIYEDPTKVNVDYYQSICYKFLSKLSVLVDDIIGVLKTCDAPNTGFLKAYLKKVSPWHCHLSKEQTICEYF
jgi:hypothetical protein